MLSKILACCDLPGIKDKLYKKYEANIGAAIEKAAQESCELAAAEEKKLVIENIQKLCKEL